jgi:hypothetical protein
VTKAEAEKAAADLESIYVVDRRYFGSEPNPFEDPVNLAPGLPPGWREADCDPLMLNVGSATYTASSPTSSST